MTRTMTLLLHATAVRTFAVLFILMGLVIPAAAQDRPSPGFAKEGAYIGFGVLPNFTIDAEEFTGGVIYVSEDDGEQTVIPTLDKRPVFRTIVGFRARPAALEFSYDRAEFKDDFLGLTGNSAYNSINVDVRVFFMTRSRIQPYILAGGAFQWVHVDDGSYAPGADPFFDAPIGDAGFKGYGLNTEAGVAVFATRRAWVTLGGSYRVLWFRHGSDSDEEREDLKPPFEFMRASASVTGFFTF